MGRMLERPYEARWAVDGVIGGLAENEEITLDFTKRCMNHLREAVNDPDYLWFNAPRELIDGIAEVDSRFWIN